MTPDPEHTPGTPPADGLRAAAPRTSGGVRPFGVRVARLPGGRVVLAVSGAVDWATAGALRDGALDEIAGGARRLVLDLSAMQFWDSAGLSAVALAHRGMARSGGSVALAGLSPHLERRYRLTGMDRVVPVHRDVRTALFDG